MTPKHTQLMDLLTSLALRKPAKVTSDPDHSKACYVTYEDGTSIRLQIDVIDEAKDVTYH